MARVLPLLVLGMLVLVAGCGQPKPVAVVSSVPAPSSPGPVSQSHDPEPTFPSASLAQSHVSPASPAPRVDANGCRVSRTDPVGATAPDGSVGLQVRAVDGVTGQPVAGAWISAIAGPAKRLSPLDLDPFFNLCLVATAATDGEGRVGLRVAPGAYRIAHDGEHYKSDAWTWELQTTTVDAGGATATLTLSPRHLRLEWHGTIAGVDPTHATPSTEVRNATALAAGSAILARLDIFSPDSLLYWNNTGTWADLFVGLAVGDDPMFTTAFFNDPEGPGDGPHREDSFGQWIDYEQHWCESQARGLTLVAYNAGGIVAPGAPAVGPAPAVGGLPFHWVLTADLRGPADPSFHRAACT